MDSERWGRIQELFHQAAELPLPERRSFLRTACAGDPALEAEVEAMVQADEDTTGGSVLDRGMEEIAADMFEEAADFSSLTLPFVVGPYRLVEFLGQGGMGVVYKAERIFSDSKVAMKLLVHAGLSPARRENFTREIRAQSKLEHPFIARLYDTGTLDGTPWFVMEYVEGKRLMDYCLEPGRTVAERIGLFRRICQAVEYAHREGVIHRDLKPSNILVKADGTPRLLDFGIARELQQLEESGELTLPGLRFMTIPYAAPEWVQGGKSNVTTDVYALGVILYQMLSGQMQLTGPLPKSGSKSSSKSGSKPGSKSGSKPGPAESSGLQTTRSHPAGFADRMFAFHIPERPSTAARRLPDQTPYTKLSREDWNDLDKLCLAAMHLDPVERYQSVEALLRDVNHFLNEEPLEKRQGNWRYRAGKFLRKYRGRVLAGAAALLVIAALSVGSFVSITRARDAALAEAARTQRIQQFMLTLLGGSDTFAGPSNDQQVKALLDHGVQEATNLASDPETQTALYDNLGNMYDRLGDYPRADGLFTLALERRRTSMKPDDPRIAESLEHLAQAKADQSKFMEAEQLAQQAVNLAGRYAKPDSFETIQANSALGRVFATDGEFKKAIAILEPLVRQTGQAGRSESSGGSPEEFLLSQNLSTLTSVEYEVADVDRSDLYGNRSLELDRRLYGEKHPQVAFDLANLAENRAALAQLDKAEAYYRQADRILRDWYGPDHPDLAMIDGLLARVLQSEGKDAEAESLLRHVLEVQMRAYNGRNERIAVTLDTLGQIDIEHGNISQAETDFARAFAMESSLFGDDHLEVGIFEADLGDVYLREQQFSRAEELLRKAVKIVGEHTPADSINIADADASLGRALIGLKRFQEAEKPMLTAYTIYLEQGHPPVPLLDGFRRNLIAIYTGLHQSEHAEKYRSQLGKTNAEVAAEAKK
jgi:serine/threonine-protein kinase